MAVSLNSVAESLAGYLVPGDGVTFVATSTSGDWPASTRLRVVSAAGVETAFTPVIASTLATWTLTVAEVTALIGTRTSGQIPARITTGTGDAMRGVLAGPLTLISEWTGVRGTQSLGAVMVGGWVAWDQTAYAATIPLDAATYMPQATISTAVAFTADATPTAGGSCVLNLISDGSHTPTFAGMLEHGSSAGWVSGAGLLNVVTVWFDGVRTWYSIAQDAAGSVMVAPVLSTAAVEDADNDAIVLGYDIALDAASVPATSAYTVAASGGAVSVSSVAIHSRFVTVGLSRPIAEGEAVTISYTVPGSNPVQGTGGYDAAALANQAVTNNVVDETVVRMTINAGTATIVESGNSSGWIYTITDATNAGSTKGITSPTADKIAASTDGYFIFQLGYTPGTRTPEVTLAPGDTGYGYVSASSLGLYVSATDTTDGVGINTREGVADYAQAAVTHSSGLWWKLGREGATTAGTSVLYLERSTDGGATYARIRAIAQSDTYRAQTMHLTAYCWVTAVAAVVSNVKKG